jgi:hypothetical protein
LGQKNAQSMVAERRRRSNSLEPARRAQCLACHGRAILWEDRIAVRLQDAFALDPAGVRAGARGDELLFDGYSHKRDENNGLRTERQIALYRQREAAKRERAERRELEAQVRHSNFELIQRAILLLVGVAIGVALIIGATGEPNLLKLALVATTGWATLAAALYRRGRPKQAEKTTNDSASP